jgi:arginase
VTRLLEPGAIPDGPLYVHFDVDILDPAEAPAMNYPAPGGPSSQQLKQVFETLAATGRVAAISVSTWDPALDTDGQTEAVVQSVLKSANRRGIIPNPANQEKSDYACNQSNQH